MDWNAVEQKEDEKEGEVDAQLYKICMG